MTVVRTVHPQENHTDEYEHIEEEIVVTQDDAQDDDWCNNNGVDEMNSLQSHEQQKLIRHLKDISITLDDYLKGSITITEACNTVKRKYSYYKCTHNSCSLCILFTNTLTAYAPC